MATFADKIALIITATSTQAVSELKKVGSTAETSFAKAETSSGKLGAGFAAAGAGAAAAGALVAVLGAISVKSALEGEAATARLNTAIVNVGGSTAAWAPKVRTVSEHMAKLGFSNIEVTDSVARLIPATHSVGEALKLQGTAADIARQRGISLGDATSTLIQLEGSRYKAVGLSLGLSKAVVGAFRDQHDAISAVSVAYKDAANAFSKTPAGQIAALGAETKNLAQNFGALLAPTVSLVARGLNAVIAPLVHASNGFDSTAANTRRLSVALADSAAAEDTSTTAAQKLKAAHQQLENILSGVSVGNLGDAFRDLATDTDAAAVVQERIAGFEAQAQLQADLTTGAVLTLADAYLILGQSAAQAAATSFSNLSNAASAQFDATQKTAQASDQYNESLVNLTKSAGGGGGGAAGATKNLTAAYYEQQQKLAAVRDATQAVSDTQYELSKANRDNQQSVEDLAAAQQNYQDVLNGVSKQSPKGQDAREAAKRAKDDAQSSGLDLQDAIKTLQTDRAKHESDEQIRRDEIAVREARLDLHDATVKYEEAQRVLNGTLHGFAAGSPEVVQAQKDLQDAEDKVHDSLKAVRESTDAAADAQVNLGRTSDDLQGKLDKISTSHAAGQIDSFRGKLNTTKRAAVEFASSVGAEVTAATGSVAAGIQYEIQTLKTIVDQQPALAGAFDGILANLLVELARILPKPVPIPAGNYSPGPNIAGPPSQFTPGAPGSPTAGPPRYPHAMGGPVYGGRAYLVGEHGAETFVPKMAGHIVPNGGGGQVNVYVTINNPTGNGREIADQLVPALKSGHRRKELAGLLS